MRNDTHKLSTVQNDKMYCQYLAKNFLQISGPKASYSSEDILEEIIY